MKLQFVETTLETDGAILYCRTIGQGPPLIVLHGGPGLGQDYLLPEMSKLSDDRFVIFYDQRGCGKSKSELNPDSINLENFVHDLDAIRNYFGFETVSILGHSWGGLLAMHYADAHPKSIEKLILSNSVPASSDEFQLFIDEWLKRIEPYQDKIQTIQASDEFALGAMESFYRLIFRTYCYIPNNANLLNLKMDPTAALNGMQVYNILRENVLSKPYNIHKQLNAFNIPTLIIHGDFDPIPHSTAYNMHLSIPNSKYVLIENCGHFPYVEACETYFGHLREFLNKKLELTGL